MGALFLRMVLALVFVFGVSLIFAVVMVLLAFMGSAGVCGGSERLVSASPELAASFQRKWDAFNATLDGRQPATVSLTEGEVTSRGRQFLDESNAPVEDLKVCLNEGEGEGSARIDLPIVGDAEVRVRGTMTFVGIRPRVVIHEIDVGSIPGPIADLARAAVRAIINDQLNKLELKHRYSLEVHPEIATLRGEP